MVAFDPEPSETAVADENEEWAQSQDTQTRIRAVVTGLREPATVSTIADRAACSANAARKHLSTLAQFGIINRFDDDTGGVRYARNESYFRWRQANELATTNTIDSLLDSLAAFEEREEQFRTQFDAATPSDVDLPDGATHAEIEDRLDALSEWETVRESIDRHKEALRIARRNDDRLTA